MEKETKIAIVVIAVISFIFATAFSFYLNSLLSDVFINYVDSYILTMEDGRGMVRTDYMTFNSVCDFDIYGTDFSCQNQSTGDLIDCSEFNEITEDIRFMGPIPMDDCDKDKLDAAFDNDVSYGHISLSVWYAITNQMRYYRSSLQDTYSKESFFSLGKTADLQTLLILVAYSGSNWVEINQNSGICWASYNGTEKSIRCLNSLVDGFDSVSSELMEEISFDAQWHEACMDMLLERTLISAPPPFIGLYSSVGSGEMCSRMTKIFVDIQDSVKGGSLNKAEKLFLISNLHLINRFHTDGYKRHILSEKLAERLDPEFQEVKDEIMLFIERDREMDESG